MEIKEKIGSLVEERLATTENFLVEVKSSPGKIAVIIDHPRGVKIEDCADISRYLHDMLDESGLFDRNELEVGSPGIEEPLKILPQYLKRIGQRVSVITFDGLKHTGRLVSADEAGIGLEEESAHKQGKKKEISRELRRILFTDIKETRVIFSFDKII